MSNSVTYLTKTYNDDEIISANYSKKQSLNMSELSVDTAEITLRPYLNFGFFTHEHYPMFTNENLRFETSEANPLAGEFEQNTPIKQYKDGSKIAVWYLQSIERKSKNVYLLNAMSALGKLTQITHYGGIYTGEIAADVIADIIGNQVSYQVDSVFQSVPVYGWLPIGTARDNLQQVLFALNASLTTDEAGKLRIENLSTETSAIVSETDIYGDNANVVYNTPITKVVVLEHQYTVGSETKQLFDGNTTGNQIVTFDEPMSGLSATSGLTIVYPTAAQILDGIGTNYAIINGIGTLTGKPFIHTTREITRTVSAASVENVVRVENATLVGLYESGDVADRLAAYYACRNVINVSVAEAFLNAGDVADVYDPYDEVMRNTTLEKCQVTASSVSKSTISALVGFTPWQVGSFTEERIVLTSTSTATWTVPAGVTQIKAVLIGGGSGGKKGGSGKQGTSGAGSSSSGYSYYAAGVGGDGGIGGVGGSPGRILRINELTVTPGQTFTYKCGAKGTGGASPTVGAETTFGEYSTDSGEISESGYIDPVTGDKYALPGQNGINGGKGGDGGSASSSAVNVGNPGANVGEYQGGLGGKGSMQDQHDWEPPAQFVEAYGGAGGGGASAEAIGKNATNATRSQEYRGDGSGYAGAGAGAVTQSWSNTDYGCGGNGGNGGGGGGGAGGYYWWTPDAVWAYFQPHPGAGGSGGAGADGVNGCIILYYRQPKQ